MSTAARPAEEVHNFLGRPGPRRSTRTLGDHLRPPLPPTARAATGPPAPPTPSRPPTPTPTPPPTPTVAVGSARPGERVLELDGERPVMTVRAGERTGATLRILLQWDRPVTSTGLRRSTDIHLGCLWETRDRHSGVVQSLGDRLMAPGFGARQVLRLGPRSEEGEEILADGKHLDVLRRVYLYAYARSSALDPLTLAPRLSLRSRDGGRVVLTCADPTPTAGGDARPGAAGARVVLLASLHDVDGDLVVRRENVLVADQRTLAHDYGFADLPWAPDGSTPRSP
ncbi:hypothetical protein ACFFKU_10930 [Kineococcus gynurae]|uniref:Uncharacterized protein n=1 Tax=Kineococcus gynurae TaxID=452979 RepID=A0ABV5LUN2_9ACTN